MPLAVAVLLCHLIGVPMVRAEQGRVEQVVIPGSIKLLDPGIPGASGMEGMEPVDGAPAMMSVERALNPRPAADDLSVERRAEMMAQARAEEGFFRPQGGGLRAIHRQSLIQLDYGSEGLLFSPHDPAALPAFTGATKPPRWTVRMKTGSMEFDGVAVDFGEPGSPLADGEKASCGLGDGCVEWVVNRAEGFEHGYTITAPPLEGEPVSELAMVISLETSLLVMPGDDALLFQDQAGKTRMSYSKLMVFDAEGRELESAMVLNEVGDELRLEADVRGAWEVSFFTGGRGGS
ncbi:hypothetical protein [Haloferula sp.]|uniref:hypothetical protein n=1 Tax=Haloferula sp. TaxID=2497595 RepID=UPI003C72A51E